MSVGYSRLQWFGWLRTFLNSWVRVNVEPSENIFETLEVDSKLPVCYVLKSNSIFDFLILDLHCARKGLPRPLSYLDELGSTKDATSIYLSRVGVLRTYGAYRNEPPSPFFKLLGRVNAEPDFDVQLVPISVFWGRGAARSQVSILKLLFTDDDRASFFHKLFIVLAQGKNVTLTYSKPILLREQHFSSSAIDETARKLTRVVRVHFQSLRTAILGPGLISRNRVIETLVRGKTLKLAIDDESRKKGVPRERSELLAKEYISEIAAELSPEVIAGLAILLRRLWAKIYTEVKLENVERVRNIPANAEIVYVPCHRSHLDYLLLNSVLFESRLVSPHIAAGINLNFWPVGSLLRRVGAFYIRRSFNNNRLYAAVFSEYVAFLIQKGFPVQFFLEGGRSRTGKLLAPKTGVLAMVVNSFLKNHDRPIYFVPVYMGYDRVLEVKTYRKELTGAKKKTESVGQLVASRKALNSTHGRAYVSFAEPFSLGDFLDAKQPGWANTKYDEESKVAWLNPLVHSVANRIMVSINETAAAGSVALVSLILLATRQRALPEDELIAHVEAFQRLAKAAPYSANSSVPSGTGKSIVEEAETFARLSRFSHPGGDVIHAVEPQASYIVYYRNNIAHLFCLPAVIAYFLQHNDSIHEKNIREGVLAVYPILKKEFFLRWDISEVDEMVSAYVQVFIELGFFARSDSGVISRPSMTSPEFSILRTLALIMGAALERFAIATHLLNQYDSGIAFKMEEFQKKCVLMSQRISLLSGTTDLELPSPQLYVYVLEQLAVLEMIEKLPEQAWKLTDRFPEMLKITSALLSVDVRQSMARVKG
jgi:glycerol-3-phosphate O-acyltransferase